MRAGLGRRLLLPPLLAVLSAGCVGAGRSPSPMAVYDLGPPANVQPAAIGYPLRSLAVDAPSWLESPAMQYRLLYADPARLASYGESRWAARPAELLEQTLGRAVGEGGQGAGPGCRLAVDLDEFVQSFHSPTESEAVIEVRVRLLPPRGEGTLAARNFSIARPAAAADARAGVEAFRAAAQDLGTAVREWLAMLDRAERQDLNIGRICRGG
jgi:cholesterol transport system auxiliary component